jgi:hypothetical protein
MRIKTRQPGIDRQRLSDRGRWAFPRKRPAAMGLARMLIGLALTALLAQPAAAAKDEKTEKAAIPSWYALALVHGETGLNVTYLWSLQSKLRSETVIRGFKFVTIVNGDTYYVYDAIAMTGIAIRRAPAALAAESPDRRPFGNEAQLLIDQGGEKVREESVAGKRVDVYQITDDSGRRIVWVTQDDRRLPIRLEFFKRKSGSKQYMEYVDWVGGISLSNLFFEPEPGIRFDRFELDEYIETTLDKDTMVTYPIFHQELLHGPAPR